MPFKIPNRLRTGGVFVLSLVIALTLTDCSRRESPNAPSADAPLSTVRIAEQFGLAYAPLAVVRSRGLLEARLPGTEVEWIQLGNASAIREAMLAGRLDIGFMGIPPFLIGADKGMRWRVFTGLSRAPLALITTDPAVRSLADLTPEHRIALPQPGSIQHILLSMASQREFGDPNRFDNQLLTLAHPDAMTALLSGAGVTAHFASPPYVYEELAADGTQSILSGREAFGGLFTFIVGVASPDFGDDTRGRAVLQTLGASLAEAMALIQQRDSTVVAELAGQYGVPVGTLQIYLDNPELIYTSRIEGLGRFLEVMTEFGYLTNQGLRLENLVLSEEVLR